MDFELTDDQRQLQTIVRDVATRECPGSYVRAVIAGDHDGESLWKTYVGLDWPSLTIPENDGGIGYSTVELVLMAEELGAVADPTPLLATSSNYLPLVRESASPRQRQSLLTPLCSGSTGAAALGSAEVSAHFDNGECTLQGVARNVLDGDRAESVALVASSARGEVVCVVPRADLRATRTQSFDATLHIADVNVDGVVVDSDRVLLAGGSVGIERARQEAVTGLAATMVGASRRILDLALAHVRDRHQFGVPIGSFQAIKHMAVDMYLSIERARVLCQFAALAIAEDDPRRQMAASMAKAAAGDCQRISVRHGIQLFGGLGFTWENDLHLYVRRAKAGELLLGTSANHNTHVARAVFAALEPVR